MPSATVLSPSDHHHHLHLESLHLVDLRLLSQSELLSLSSSTSCPSSASSFHHHHDDVLIPKIDRSVFNESAGSRKQTFSRLRLAPRNIHFPSSTFHSLTTPSHTLQPLPEENSQIITLLKQLFASQSRPDHNPDGDLIPVKVEYKESLPESSDLFLQTIPIDIVDDQITAPESSNVVPRIVDNNNIRKRKRGRPRKDENGAGKEIVEEEKMVMENENGVVVDFSGLANMEDPYGEELRRRTMGLETKEALLGFMRGLGGKWGSRRKKRMIVEASQFGDALPRGWKLKLCLKKKADRMWLICSQFISPNGQQFLSCKEASSYLLSFFGRQDANQPNSSHFDDSIILTCKMTSGNAADISFKDNEKGDNLVCCQELPITSISTEHEKQATLLKTGSSGEVQTGEKLRCHKCTMTFYEKDHLLCHLLSSHKGRGKRCKSGTSISEEVIMKDGKYECQLCHKLFGERKRYDGHFGVHMKDYVKRVEALVGVRSTQKSIDPISMGVPPQASKIQESIGIDMDSIEKNSIARANDGLSYGFAPTEFRTGTISESHKLDFLFHYDIDMKAEGNDTPFVKESCDKQDKVCNITNAKVGNVDVATDVLAAKPNVCLGAETDLSNNDNNSSFCEFDDELKSTSNRINNCISQEGGSRNNSIASPGNERAGIAENTLNVVCISSIDECEPEIESESALLPPNCKEQATENIEGMSFTSAMEVMEIDDRDRVGNDEPISGLNNSCTRLEDAVYKAKQRSSETCSLVPYGNVQIPCFKNNVNGFTSVGLEPMLERRSNSCLPSSSINKQPCFFNNNANNISVTTSDWPKLDKVTCGYNEPKIGSGSNNAMPDEDAVTGNEQERHYGSYSVIPFWNDQMCVFENNTNGDPKNHWQVEGSANSLYTLADNKLTFGFDVNKVSTGTVEEHKLDEVRNFRNDDLIFSFGSSDTGVDGDMASKLEQERSAKGRLVVPSLNEQTFSLNHYGFNDSTMEDSNQGRGSESGVCRFSSYKHAYDDGRNVNKASSGTVAELKHGEVKSSWNSGVFTSFGRNPTGIKADDMRNTARESISEGCSDVFSRKEQTFAAGNHVVGVRSSTVEDPKQNRCSENGLLYLSNGEQTCGVVNNLNKFYAGTFQGGPRFGDVDIPRNKNLIIGLGNNSRPSEDVMTELMWRTNEGSALPSGLADTSSPLVQSSGCFPNFEIMPDKGVNELFSVNESISGFEGLRSSIVERMEYSFMTAQASSHSGDSKVLAYDAEMAQGFDSPVWLEKEALPLFPKVGSRDQVTSVCAWCRNEFRQVVASGTQTGSMDFMCATCKAKFSGKLSLF